MARAVGTSLVGGPEIARRLKLLGSELTTSAAIRAVEKMADDIETDWKRRAPVGKPPEDEHPGLYRDSISAKTVKTRSGAAATIFPRTVAGWSRKQQPANYAGKLEFGTSNQAAQPSARPAFDSQRERAMADAKTVLLDAIAQIEHS